MSESENESINEFAHLIHRVHNIKFLEELLSFIDDDIEIPDTNNDMKKHMIMFVKGRHHNKHIRKMISDRKKELNPHASSSSSSSQHGGRRRTKRKSHRKNRKTQRRS